MLKKIALWTLGTLAVLALVLWFVTRPDTADLALAETAGPYPTLAKPDP